MEDEDVAMDFMKGLNDARYAEFKVWIINSLANGAINQPQTLNEMYTLASTYLVQNKNAISYQGGASFATLANEIKPKRKGNGRKPESNAKEAKKDDERSSQESGQKQDKDNKKGTLNAISATRKGTMPRNARWFEAQLGQKMLTNW